MNLPALVVGGFGSKSISGPGTFECRSISAGLFQPGRPEMSQ
jgi:hypothetical protein